MLTIVVDVSHMAHRHAHALRTFKTSDGRPSGHVFGSFKNLKHLFYTLKPDKLVFAYDRKATWRSDLVPEYKATRKYTQAGPSVEDLPEHWNHTDFGLSDRYQEHFTPGPDVERLFRCFPGVHLSANNAEADDMVYHYVSTHEGEDIRIYSGDKDLLQMVSDTRRVQGLVSKKPKPGAKNQYVPLMEEDAYVDFEAPPSMIPAIKAVLGDVSDNIQGLTGASRPGKKAALREFVAKEPGYLVGASVTYAGVPDWLVGELQSQQDRMVKNFSIVNLALAPKHYIAVEEVVVKGELAHAMGVLLEFECTSLVTQVEGLFQDMEKV